MMDPAAMFQYERKVKTVEELCKLIGPRPRARKVIMCHGVFDIVHPGHVRHLIYAKSKGDVLVVSVTADEHIAKGNVRPYVPETLRAINLAAFEMVDYVIIDRDPTPLANLRQIQPDYYAKGYEYVAGSLHPKTQEELRVLESYGGEVLFTPGDIVYSSSRLIDQSPPDIASDKLLVFLTRRDVEATNNKSERALRPSVIFRRVTNGFRSEWGAKVYADLRSIVTTGRLAGRSALAAIRDALAAPTPERVAA